MKPKCETIGCEFTAEFYDPMENKLCIDCIQEEVDEGVYDWEDCELIEKEID